MVIVKKWLPESFIWSENEQSPEHFHLTLHSKARNTYNEKFKEYLKFIPISIYISYLFVVYPYALNQ